jgi:signal transduction histidine kinase
VAAVALGTALRLSSATGLGEAAFAALADQVYQAPSSLIPYFLIDADRRVHDGPADMREAVHALQRDWNHLERERQLLCDLQGQLVLNGILTTNVWFTAASIRWLAMLEPNWIEQHTTADGKPVVTSNEVTAIHFFPRPVVAVAIEDALREAGAAVPPYFTFQVEVAGESFASPREARVSKLAPLAQATGSLALLVARGISLPGEQIQEGPEFEAMPSHPPFLLSLYLSDPAALYALQRQRTLWFGALVLAVALTAVIGFIRARRAFLREHQLSELKSNFVSSVSHELRAPIASVRLMAESLERGKVADQARQQEYFRFIVQECRRLSSLIANVLDFSRIEQGRKLYEFEPTDITALVRETVRLMETYASEKEVTVSLKLPAEPALVTHDLEKTPFQPLLDARSVQQALINLIDNALKHSPKESVVTVALDMVMPPGCAQKDTGSPPCFYVWVEDRGPGIPAAEHERIFERFYRLGSELRRETQGVGIGLSIVKHIVEAHGGRVIVQSQPGEGSRFTIELPLRHEMP